MTYLPKLIQFVISLFNINYFKTKYDFGYSTINCVDVSDYVLLKLEDYDYCYHIIAIIIYVMFEIKLFFVLIGSKLNN